MSRLNIFQCYEILGIPADRVAHKVRFMPLETDRRALFVAILEKARKVSRPLLSSLHPDGSAPNVHKFRQINQALEDLSYHTDRHLNRPQSISPSKERVVIL